MIVILLFSSLKTKKVYDRLGSTRQIINTSGNVVRYYTYEPFGEVLEEDGTLSNNMMFTGQYFDTEIDQYYLRARQYDPHISRFTARDPIHGKFEEPMTLHRYLYCSSNPLNRVDPSGLWTIHIQRYVMGSLGPTSLMFQWGLVIDDDGNIGWMVTSNLDARLEVTHSPGVGIPAVSAGTAIGYTNADTIFDLQGQGISIGGSGPVPFLPPPFSIGVDYIGGEQRSGELYHGFEFTLGVGLSVIPSFEAHGHNTYTGIKPWNINYRNPRQSIQDALEEELFNVETVGKGYLLLWCMGLTD